MPLPVSGWVSAISKAIMKAHEGKISGESRPDGGARFTLIFPFLSPPEMKDDFPIREDS